MPPQYIDVRSAVDRERAASRAQAAQSVPDVLAWVEGEATELPLHKVEKALFTRLLALGVHLVALWVTLRLPTEVVASCEIKQGRYRWVGLSGDLIRTRFGVVPQVRGTYSRVRGKGPALLSPDDRTLGLAPGRMSFGVHLLVAHLAARMPFEEGHDVMGLLGGYAPATRSALGIVDHVGPLAKEYLDQCPPPEGDGEILVIQVDGKGAPMLRVEEHEKRCRPHVKREPGTAVRGVRRRMRRENPKPRRAKGDKSRNKRMATVGVVYTLRRMPDGTLEGPVNKQILATFGGMDSLFQQLQRAAVQRGYGTKPTYFLADGAHALWSKQRAYFPEATPCLDWYHLSEYLWEAGGVQHAEGSAELAEWVHARQESLRAGDVHGVLAALDEIEQRIGKSGPGTKGRRQRLGKCRKFIEGHLPQLTYPALITAGVDIATGVIEGTVKHVVGARLDGSEMRWSPTRAAHVLALRLVIVNGGWSGFEEYAALHHERHAEWAVRRITPARPVVIQTDPKRKKVPNPAGVPSEPSAEWQYDEVA